MTTFAEMGSFLRTLGHELTEEEVVTMVQHFDTDGSGDIGFPEFVQLIREQVLAILQQQNISSKMLHFSNKKQQFSNGNIVCCKLLRPFAPIWLSTGRGGAAAPPGQP